MECDDIVDIISNSGMEPWLLSGFTSSHFDKPVVMGYLKLKAEDLPASFKCFTAADHCGQLDFDGVRRLAELAPKLVPLP